MDATQKLAAQLIADQDADSDNRTRAFRYSRYAQFPLEDVHEQNLTDEEMLNKIRQAQRELNYAEWFLVQQMRDDGATWEQIGALYKVTRQRAQQRFGG